MGEGWGTVRGRREEGGWGVVIAGSFQALEVEEEEERRKITCCVQKERRDRERVWISELLKPCGDFILPSPLLSCTGS